MYLIACAKRDAAPLQIANCKLQIAQISGKTAAQVVCYRAVILGTLPGAARLAQVVAWVMGWGGEDRTTLSGVGAAAGTDGRGRDLAILTSCVAARCKRHTRDVRLGIIFLYESLHSSHPHVLAY